MAATYPLFVIEKDDQSMQRVEDPSHVCTLEAIGVLNCEHVFWDAAGNGVSVTASVTSFKPDLGNATPCDALLSLRDACSSYVKTLRLPDFDVDGPERRLASNPKKIGARPKKRSFLSRSFR